MSACWHLLFISTMANSSQPLGSTITSLQKPKINLGSNLRLLGWNSCCSSGRVFDHASFQRIYVVYAACTPGDHPANSLQ